MYSGEVTSITRSTSITVQHHLPAFDLGVTLTLQGVIRSPYFDSI